MRSIGLVGLTATGIASMVGAGIYVVPFMIQRHVPGIGPGVLLAYVLAAVPAKVFDLSPLKGSLAPGADADFTLVDLNKERVLHAADFASYADYNLHEGWNLKGWPVRAISRGVTVMDDHKMVGKGGHGKYLWRRIGQPPLPGKTR